MIIKEMTNYTEEDNRNTLDSLACVVTSTDLYQLVFLMVLNILLSITAILGNSLVMLALHKESSLHAPSKLMFRCLAITDLGVGLISQPLLVAKIMLALNEQQNLCYYLTILDYTLTIVFSGVSLLTVTAISVDRLLALSLGLRYRQVVTLRRVRAVTGCLWLLSITLALMQRFWNYNILARVISAVISLSLLTSLFCYLKIFYGLRHHQAQVHNQFHGQPNDSAIGNNLNIMLYKKTVSTGIWVQLTLVACYLPQALVFPLISAGEASLIPIHSGKYALTLVYLNSTLNPIIYCWKINALRQALKEVIKQMCCIC